MSADLILTIDSDAEPEYTDTAPTKSKKRKREREQLEESKGKEPADFAAGFLFDGLAASSKHVARDAFDLTESIDLFKRKNALPHVSVDDIIARRRNAVEQDGVSDGSASSSTADDDEEMPEDEDFEGFSAASEEGSGSDEASIDGEAVDAEALGEEESIEEEGEGFAALRQLDDEGDGLESAEESEDDALEDELEPAKDSYFAAPTEKLQKEDLPPFSALPNAKLSRPLLLGLSSMGLSTPTPIQAATIPVVLLGKDVVGSSVTGSGKTVAFWVGVIERLLHRDKRSAKTRVVCLCPTRELAVQVFNVGKALARYTDISFCLCVGGLSLKGQEAELKRMPDIVVSTPGRLIDHVRNTPCFTLDSLEILIIDEADRILEEGFRDELTEIVGSCPHSRSTLLFSATITEDVKELARLSLDKPVRLKIDTLGASSRTLTQEFLRVRDGRLRAKEAVLVAICRRTFQGKTIVFFRSKATAHRVQVVFGLAGLRSAELHGDLSQEQRLRALERFRSGDVDYLLATDLASRGLDIKGVENVINFEMPVSVEVYLHRVGRTARAGKSGRALTLVGEEDRKLVKVAVKHADPESVKQRSIPGDLVKTVASELAELEDEINAVLEEEKEEKAMRRTEMELKKGENLLEHADEIKARAPRTWFQSEKEKKASKASGTRDHNAAFDAEKKPARKEKLNHKDRRRREALQEAGAKKGEIGAAVRSAKKAARPGKITAAPSASTLPSAKPKKLKKSKAGGFGTDLGDKRSAKKTNGTAAKPRSTLGKKAAGKPDVAKLKAKIRAAAPSKLKNKKNAKGGKAGGKRKR